ncbi:hypothetical protein C2845_PM02G16330 [Panicum miliaceum]|uniref:Uncharacterized protein n=1 Tax=Panicum miliaceum TaxID=4540 RepID=A0A3L6S9T6_PANMI|nr:hypothetical protein C2845_PM02G16330 [Panicum miliaceum]
MVGVRASGRNNDARGRSSLRPRRSRQAASGRPPLGHLCPSPRSTPQGPGCLSPPLPVLFFSPDANKQLVAEVERSGGRREDARAEDEDADHCEPPAGAAARHPLAPNQSPTQEALDSPLRACRGRRRWRGGRCTWSSPSRTTASCPRRTRWCTPPPSPEPALTARAARWTGERTCAASSSRPLAHATSVDDSVATSVFKDKLPRFNSIVPDFAGVGAGAGGTIFSSPKETN